VPFAGRAGGVARLPTCLPRGFHHQSLSAEKYNPSRRRMAEMPPVSAARSGSSKMRSLSFAVKLRRFGVVVNSAPGALGAVTTWAGEVAGEISDTASAESGICEGIPMGPVFFALKCKLQPVGGFTVVGTEGPVQMHELAMGEAIKIASFDKLALAATRAAGVIDKPRRVRTIGAVFLATPRQIVRAGRCKSCPIDRRLLPRLCSRILRHGPHC
jgi:hypothetical protein